jgi:hypothetical protein
MKEYIMKMPVILALTSLFLFGARNQISAAPVLTAVSIGSQTPAQLTPGSPATYIVTVSRVDNGNMDVYLTAPGLPAGISASFSPAMVHFTGSTPDSATAILTLTVAPSFSGCTNRFIVKGTDGASFNNKTCVANLTMACAALPQATLTGCILPAGGFQVTCNSSPYQTCLIQATTDLGSPNWVTIGTNTADVNGLITFVDSVAKDYPARFYRTVAY